VPAYNSSGRGILLLPGSLSRFGSPSIDELEAFLGQLHTEVLAAEARKDLPEDVQFEASGCSCLHFVNTVVGLYSNVLYMAFGRVYHHLAYGLCWAQWACHLSCAIPFHVTGVVGLTLFLKTKFL